MFTTSKLITIDLLCACGTKCGELTIPADHPKGTDLKAHGIEKVECNECSKKESAKPLIT